MQRGTPLFFAMLAVSVAACSPPPAAPPQAPAAPQVEPAPLSSDPGWTGLTAPEEIIEARRVLMTQTERLMKPVDGFIVGEPADAALLRENAAAIEAMLLALPHLFPPTTNLFDPAQLDSPTVALPTIWQRFAAFETFAASAESAAAALAAAEDGEPLRVASERLRAACDRCHAGFMKPYTPPVVTDEDLDFDFESVLPPE
jgi:cytochrome c556